MKRDFTTGRDNNNDYCYYCLDVRGDIFHKPKGYNTDALELDGDIKIYWKVGTANLDDAIRLLIRAYVEGGNKKLILGLATAWKLDDNCLTAFLKRERMKFTMHDNIWTVSAYGKPEQGTGSTLFKAYCEYYSSIMQEQAIVY